MRDRALDDSLIVVGHLSNQFRLSTFAMSDCTDGDFRTRARNRSRPKIGASERKDRTTNLSTMSGDANNDDTVSCAGDAADATV